MLVVGLKLKTQLLGKHIFILFLLWKWIQYIFVLFVLTICIKRCLELRVLLWNQLELLYSLHKEIEVGPPFPKIFIIHLRKKPFKSKWCRIWFKYRSCSCTFSFFWIIKKNVRWNIYVPPEIHIYIGIFCT